MVILVASRSGDSLLVVPLLSIPISTLTGTTLSLTGSLRIHFNFTFVAKNVGCDYPTDAALELQCMQQLDYNGIVSLSLPSIISESAEHSRSISRAVTKTTVPS